MKVSADNSVLIVVDPQERLMPVIRGRDSLEESLGQSGTGELLDAMVRGEQAMRAWKSGEPRVWGYLARAAARSISRSRLLRRLAGRPLPSRT